MLFSFHRRLLRFRLFAALIAAAVALPGTRGAEPKFNGPKTIGRLEAPPRREASGLAASRRSPGVWWLHDDSGGPPVLYAVDATGRNVGALRLTDLRNRDWEDLAAFTHEGKSWLLIADAGDNDADRGTVLLHMIEEPARERLAPARETPAVASWTVRVRYEDGARDCEAMAVDAAEGMVYLLTKRDDVPRLYRVPFARSDAVVTARFAGTVPAIAGNGRADAMLKALVGKKFAWPTAMDFSADGTTAIVLTYGDVLVFPRRSGEPWATALARAPQHLGYHGLPQAEGAAFSADGTEIRIVSETVSDFLCYSLEKK